MRASTTSTAIRRALTATVAAVALLVVGAPTAGAQTVEKAIWGPAEFNGVAQFPVYKKLGVNVFQLSVSWAATAPTQPADPRNPADPAYQWPADVDLLINEARSNGMKVLLQLSQAPTWANANKSPEYAPTRPADFADFTRAAAARYPTVNRWMIWGEPSRSNNWKPFVQQPLGAALTPAMQVAPRRYARLLDAAYGQLKAARRSNIVIGGNTYVTGEVRPGDWMHSMRLPNGKPPRIDLYGHNPFSSRKPDLRNPQSGSGLVDFSDLGRFAKDVQRRLGTPRGKRVRLWLPEFTIPTAPDSEFNYYVTPKLQATWITAAFKVARQVGAAGLGWIHVRDVAGAAAISGGLITATGQRKPGFYAFMRG
jgi:hypothetical protein